MGRETELIRARRNHPRVDMEDLEGNVNRANAKKTFRAVFFIFNSVFSLSKQNSTQLLIL